MVTTGQFVTGMNVLRVLEDGVQQARRQSRQLRAELDSLEETIRELVARKGEALTDLAEHYLPEITHDHIRQTFHAIRADLMQILHRKELREKQLQEEWDALVDQRQQMKLELDSVTETLNKLVARREELEARVAERLQDNEQFQELTAKIVDNDEALHRNERRVDEIQQEAAEKLPAYENSRLFQYLYKRRFGTPDYPGRGLFRRWDRWIANMIGYPRARRSYDFLRVTPELMAAEVERRRTELSELLQQAEAIEDRLAEELGLTEVLQQGDAAGARRDQLIGQLEQSSQQGEGIDQELIALQSSQNEYYDQAIARFQQFLASMKESALEAVTRSTPDPTDDRVFAEIRHLNERLDGAKQQTAHVSDEFRGWDARVGGLEQIVRRFRAAEFDSQRSMFRSGFDVGDAMSAYLRGDLATQELWASIRQHQQFAPLWHEESMRQGGDFLNSEFSQVLLQALAQAAQQAARNASHGGTIHRSPSVPRRTSRSAIPRSMPRRAPRSRPGGFTSGRGF